MPHVIEHKIRLIGRPLSPPPSPRPLSVRPTEFGRYAELEKDKSWVEIPFERTHSKEKQPRKKRSTLSGGEETFGVESFERNLRYSPHEVDRQHFGVRIFEEKNPLRGGNGGESERSGGGVRFEDPTEPHQQHENVFDQKETNHLLSRSRHLDTTPIRIPRVRIGQSVEREHGTSWTENSGGDWRHSRSTPSSFHSSSGWPSSPSPSPQCLSVDGTYSQSVPMKKIIRRSRMVSIHDGRQMGPFTETVHYEPTTIGNNSSADEGRGRSLSRRTSSIDKMSGPTAAATAFWASYSSSSLCSDEERETNERRTKNERGREEGEEKGRRRGEGERGERKRAGEREGRGDRAGEIREEGGEGRRRRGEGERGEGREAIGKERGGERGEKEWRRRQQLVQVQHNPLFYGAAGRHFS